jgi:hypothetical protein
MTAGDAAEAAFVYHATLRKYNVFLPTSHHSKCDMVIKPPSGALIGIQVKKATRQRKPSGAFGDSWKFMIGSGKPWNPDRNAPRYTLYEDRDFDIMAAYIMEYDMWAFYHLSCISGKSSKRWSKKLGPINNWELIDDFCCKSNEKS